MGLKEQNIKPVAMRRGHPVYEQNPSVTSNLPMRITSSSTRKGADRLYMVSPATGEVVGQGAFNFVEEKVVDTENFIKIYAKGIRGHAELSKAGKELFECVFHEMSGRGGQDKDTIGLNLLVAQKWNPSLTRTTFYRGMNELLDKGFLFRSTLADMYFVNITFMFNGNRINVVTSYVREGTQGVLPLERPGKDTTSSEAGVESTVLRQ